MKRWVLVLLALMLGALAAAPRAAVDAQSDCVLIDDFGKSKVGAFPEGWRPRKDEALGAAMDCE